MMNVLLIEDNPDDVTFIEEELAQASGGPYHLEHAGTLAAGLKRLAREGIDVLLTDLGLPDSKGLDTFRRLRREVPHLPIIVLTGCADESVGLVAVSEGAQEFLLKSEIQSAHLARTLRYAVQRHSHSKASPQAAQSAKAGMVIGFIGAKGGVGTSTVALNVALALAKRGERVTAAEVRPTFGTFAVQLKLNPVPNLGDLLEGKGKSGMDELQQQLRKTSLMRHPAGLHVLFGPQQAQHCKEMEPAQAETLVQWLAETADFSILDLSTYPTAANRAILSRCHRLVIVLERDVASASLGRGLLDLLNSWDAGTSLAGAVIVNRAPVAVPMRLLDLRTQFNCPILGVIPPAPDLCNLALNRGTPVVLLEPSNATVLALNELAERLSGQQVRRVDF